MSKVTLYWMVEWIVHARGIHEIPLESAVSGRKI